MTTDTFLLSDTHHDESTDCQIKSILIHFMCIDATDDVPICHRLTNFHTGENGGGKVCHGSGGIVPLPAE